MHCILHIGCKAELHLNKSSFTSLIAVLAKQNKTNKYNDIAVILKLIINDIFIDIIKINLMTKQTTLYTCPSFVLYILLIARGYFMRYPYALWRDFYDTACTVNLK